MKITKEGFSEDMQGPVHQDLNVNRKHVIFSKIHIKQVFPISREKMNSKIILNINYFIINT